jgi:hypothetical protein
MSKALGRPSLYTPELADSILLELATTTKGYAQICEEQGISKATGWNWLNTNADFLDKYTQARKVQTELGFDEMKEIADAPLPEQMLYDKSGASLGIGVDPMVAMAEMQRRKLQIDTRKFGLMKLQPKRFGENRSLDVDVKITKHVSDEQFQKLMAAAVAPPLLLTSDDFEEAEEVIEDEDDYSAMM